MDCVKDTVAGCAIFGIFLIYLLYSIGAFATFKETCEMRKKAGDHRWYCRNASLEAISYTEFLYPWWSGLSFGTITILGVIAFVLQFEKLQCLFLSTRMNFMNYIGLVMIPTVLFGLLGIVLQAVVHSFPWHTIWMYVCFGGLIAGATALTIAMWISWFRKTLLNYSYLLHVQITRTILLMLMYIGIGIFIVNSAMSDAHYENFDGDKAAAFDMEVTIMGSAEQVIVGCFVLYALTLIKECTMSKTDTCFATPQ